LTTKEGAKWPKTVRWAPSSTVSAPNGKSGFNTKDFEGVERFGIQALGPADFLTQIGANS
jgi:hypothetical protein